MAAIALPPPMQSLVRCSGSFTLPIRTAPNSSPAQRSVKWRAQSEHLLLFFAKTTSETETTCTTLQLPLNCQAKNDPITGRTRILVIPVDSCVADHAEQTEPTSKFPLFMKKHFDDEIGALSLFLVDEHIVDGKETKSVASEDIRFIFDTIDGKIVHIDIPDISTTLQFDP